MRRIRILGASLGILLLGTPSAYAAAASLPATQSPSGGVTVSPAIQQIKLGEGQDQTDFAVLITNNTKLPIQIKVGFADFKALNESGGIAFLGQSASTLEQSHGLAKWVQIGEQQVGLEAGQTRSLSIHLTDLSSLPEGGHYGAVTYQVLKAVPNGAGNRVSVNQVLSSLVFLTTAGEGTQKLTMPPPLLRDIEFSIPSSIDLFLSNTGNTQSVPRGSLTIYRHDTNHPVGTAVINSQSALVLPGSTRLLSTPVAVTGRPWWPHVYHVRITYRPDNAVQFSTYNAKFLYINPAALLITVLFACMLGYGCYWSFKNKQRILPRLRGSPSHVKSLLRSKTLNRWARPPKKQR